MNKKGVKNETADDRLLLLFASAAAACRRDHELLFDQNDHHDGMFYTLQRARATRPDVLEQKKRIICTHVMVAEVDNSGSNQKKSLNVECLMMVVVAAAAATSLMLLFSSFVALVLVDRILLYIITTFLSFL